MRIPSGPSSHGFQRTSHYRKDNAEERLSHSAGHIKNQSVMHDSAPLITSVLLLSLHQITH